MPQSTFFPEGAQLIDGVSQTFAPAWLMDVGVAYVGGSKAFARRSLVRFNVFGAASEGRALWREVINNSLETLGDATVDSAAPDQSHFTVKYRVGQATGGFSAYGVDSLRDERYRKIVVAILDLAEKHVPAPVR